MCTCTVTGRDCDRNSIIPHTRQAVRLLITIAAVVKQYPQVLRTYSECATMALVIQCALRMRRSVICGLTGCAIFSTLSHQRHRFSKKLEHKMWVRIYCTAFAWSISHSEKFSARYFIYVHKPSCQSTHYSCHISIKPGFCRQIF